MPTESKHHATAGKSFDLLADDPERKAYTETLEQAPTLTTTATTKDGSIAPFPTAEFPDKLAEEVEYGAGGVKGLAENPGIPNVGGNSMPQFHNAYPRLAPDAPSAEFWKGFMTGMLELGAFLGCFFFPQLADTISRKWSLSIVSAIFIIGAIMQTAAPDYAVLVAGRTITGVGVGTMALGAPLYISEISPPQVRGTLLVLESLAIVMGVVSSYWVAYGCQYIDSEASFRVPSGLQMVSAGVIGTLIHFFPYSPRWLVLVERDEDAVESLAKLRRLPATDGRVVTEWRGILAEVQFQKIMALATATVWLSNFIVGVATPPMFSQAGFGTYVFFAIMCFLGVLWAWIFVPETKGKTLEELDDVFGDATGQEEHEVMRSVAAEARRR
ncbi:hypothetical protein D0859_04696 [Hortaea werneckii]|uniref:Major facilitator superfamily (MFS) profile domain-containing protein n=1 Tax=Hortaea werneckii TaxID=91943 RepID=A0A3M7J0A9_HORWE|nr:hypothetical protein D0859_04696 [Hortaea werneckii]